jgi:NAD(P)H-hydrate repair Nnr-like enzyme with NAD(P)H-hydrate dehydratase domain
MSPGRPRKHKTPEELAAARKAWREKAKTRSIVIDVDAIAVLTAEQERIEAELGFRPTLSQTIRYLVKRTTK